MIDEGRAFSFLQKSVKALPAKKAVKSAVKAPAVAAKMRNAKVTKAGDAVKAARA